MLFKWSESKHAMCSVEIFKYGTKINKCIGDDTKAATRQSQNCIKKTKK